jgi:hypothetical protein
VQELACYWHSTRSSQHSRPFEAHGGKLSRRPCNQFHPPLTMRLTISFVTDHILGATPEHLVPQCLVVTHLMDTHFGACCLFFGRIPRPVNLVYDQQKTQVSPGDRPGQPGVALKLVQGQSRNGGDICLLGKLRLRLFAKTCCAKGKSMRGTRDVIGEPKVWQCG